MRNAANVENWAVYEAVQGKAVGVRSVCTDSEWQALEVSHPGANVLVRSGIASEADAERLARGTSGDSVPKRPQQRVPRSLPVEAGVPEVADSGTN